MHPSACKVKPVMLEFREHSVIAWDRLPLSLYASSTEKIFSIPSDVFIDSVSVFEAIGVIKMRVVVFASQHIALTSVILNLHIIIRLFV